MSIDRSVARHLHEVRDRNADRNNALIEAVAKGAGIDISAAHPATTAVMHALVEHYRAEVAAVEQARKRGWKSLAEEFASCADKAAGIAVSLETHVNADDVAAEVPDNKRVLPLPLDLGKYAEDLERRISDAFGPAPMSTATIAIEQRAADDLVHEMTAEEWDALPAWVKEHDPHVADAMRTFNFIDPPALPKRLTFDEVREHGQARQRGEHHRSVSQVTAFAECGVRYALSDLEPPAWWLVGGRAFHACAEELARGVAERGADTLAYTVADALWQRNFWAEIEAAKAEHPDVPESTWRAAKKGAEGYDWWRVEGHAMVERFADWLRGMLAEGWSILTDSQEPVIEYHVELPIPGMDVPDLSIIDLALVRNEDQVLIVDYKAGASENDVFQLGVYGHALQLTQCPARIFGAYYRARKGDLVGPERPLTEVISWDELVYRFAGTDAMERAGVYLPNVSRAFGGCGSCSVKQFCPVGER